MVIDMPRSAMRAFRGAAPIASRRIILFCIELFDLSERQRHGRCVSFAAT
jgi:hypothetical protein